MSDTDKLQQRIAELEAAIQNLTDAKGRYNTALAYERLVAVYKRGKVD